MRPQSRAGIARTVFALALACLLAVPALGGTAIAARGDGEADLVITDMDRRGKPFYVNNTQSSTKVKVTVKNRGDRETGPTRAMAFIQPARGARRRVGSASVHQLNPGENQRVTIDFGLSRDVLDARAHEVVACADGANNQDESNERNNCDEKGKFYVVHQGFAGTLSGTEPPDPSGGSAREGRESRDARLTLGDYLGGGVFTYAFSGSVDYEMFGVDSNGCSWSGSATTSQFDPFLITTLDLQQERYTVNVGIDFTFHYTQVQTCSGFPTDHQGPTSSLVLFPRPGQVLRFGATTLSGSAEPTATGGSQTWNLNAINP